MVIDQTFFSTTYLSIFLYTLTWIEKGDRSTSAQTVKDKLYPTLLANWKIWPAAQLINFYLVPVPYRVLWANFVGLFWNVILSYLSHSSPHPPKDYDPALSTTADKLPL
jgi:protein Mpv17